LNKYLDENDFFILLLSSLCHDVDHTGRNNGFETASLSKLAIRYHDESVKENKHQLILIKKKQRF